MKTPPRASRGAENPGYGRYAFNPRTMRAACAGGAGATPGHNHAPLRSDDLFQRVSAFPVAADHGQADPAMVRRIGGGMDDLSRLLPDDAAPGLRVFGRGHASPVLPRASSAAHRAARFELCAVALRSRPAR